MKLINEALRLVRAYHDMSLTQLAEALGISKSYLSEIEHNKKAVTLELLDRYSAYFDIPKSSLLLFAEKTEDGSFGERIKSRAADKILKMLSWVESISSDKKAS